MQGYCQPENRPTALFPLPAFSPPFPRSPPVSGTVPGGSCRDRGSIFPCNWNKLTYNGRYYNRGGLAMRELFVGTRTVPGEDGQTHRFEYYVLIGQMEVGHRFA